MSEHHQTVIDRGINVKYLTTPCHITCILITEAETLLHTFLSNMNHDNRGRLLSTPCRLTFTIRRLSAHHTLLSNMYHDKRDRHSAHHTLLSNMYHSNRSRICSLITHYYLTCFMVADLGTLPTHHTLLPNMYHDKRDRHSAHHTLLSNMYHRNRSRIC